jgi:hypothetical protein
MRYLLVVCFLSTALFAQTPASGPAPVQAATQPSVAEAATTQAPPPCTTLVGDAMTLSGIDDTLAEVGRETSEQLNNRDSVPNLTIAQTAEFRSIIARNFASTSLQSEVKTKLLETCDPATMQSVVASLNTPLAQKMRALEARTQTREGKIALQLYVGNLDMSPPRAARLALIERLDKITGVTDFSVDMVIGMSRSTAAVLGLSVTKQEVDAMRPRMYANLHPVMIKSELFTYRTANDEELQSYIDLYNAPAMTRFNTDAQLAVRSALESHILAMGAEMKKAVPKRTQ